MVYWTHSKKMWASNVLSLPMRLGMVLGIDTADGNVPLEHTRHLKPGSIGVRLASISSTDGVHHRSGLTPHHDDSDDAWWEARAPRSSVFIRNNQGVALLEEPEEAANRMLLCQTIPEGHRAQPVPVECTFNASALCRCEVRAPAGPKLPRHTIECDCSGPTYDFAGIDKQIASMEQKRPWMRRTETDYEYELSPQLTFPSTSTGSAEEGSGEDDEQWVVTLQLGANQLTFDYYLGLEGSLGYLNEVVGVTTVCVAAIGGALGVVIAGVIYSSYT